MLARGHARVDDPDGVGDDDGSGPGEGAGHHALNSGKVLGGAASLNCGLLESGASPLVPVVVYEVGNGDAEKGRVEPGVETTQPLALDNVLDGLEEGRVGTFGFDLGARGERDERVAVRRAAGATCLSVACSGGLK